MKIYTRVGDSGHTSLLGGDRVPKSDGRIEAYGTVDELNAVIGLARAAWPQSPLDAELGQIQSDLFDQGARLAAPGRADLFPGAPAERVAEIERGIDAMEGELPPLKNFILPGGSEVSALLHLARTVCRRAERLVVALASEECHPVLVYLNRLSDYFFVAARFSNQKLGVTDVEWRRR